MSIEFFFGLKIFYAEFLLNKKPYEKDDIRFLPCCGCSFRSMGFALEIEAWFC